MQTKNKKWILRPGEKPIAPYAERHPFGAAPKKPAKPAKKAARPKPKKKSIRAKKPPLAKSPKKQVRRKRPRRTTPKAMRPPASRRRDDRWRLKRMGLGDLLVANSSPDDRETVYVPRANNGAPHFQKAPGTRVYDAILRVMDSGKLYRLGDIRDASGLPTQHVKGYVQQWMWRAGIVERVDAKAVARKAGPLMRERLKGYRNLWRLTEIGEAAKQEVAEADLCASAA